MSSAPEIEPDQEATVAALQSGAATGDPRPLKRLDTHMSRVFLGEDRVYKLKRSVRLPFADMSTLEARHRSCEAELEVNRALAPSLYEGVLPVARTADGSLQVGGAGEVLDWLVVMRRFPDGALLDEIARDGRLTPDLVARTAEAVAAFHAHLPPHPETGHAVDYRRIVEGLRRTEADGAAKLGVQPVAAPLFQALEHEIARHSPLIEARRRAGWVRRGHGDLHLRNICLFEGRVTPFDALEFDPALATADVIYDVAFLLMDLRARGQEAFANLAMNAWWDALGQDETALALLPLFTALRAAVRMAVAMEAGDLAEADRYRRLGLQLLAPVHPRLVAIGGLSGTGKSTVARALAPRLPGPCGARWLRTDVIRKSLAHAGPGEHLPDQAYVAQARARVYDALAARCGEAVAAGSWVIADATYREAQARAGIEAAAAAAGAPLLGAWLTAPTELRVERVAGRRNDASDATPEVARAQVEPLDLGEAWRRVDAGRDVIAIANEILAFAAAAGLD